MSHDLNDPGQVRERKLTQRMRAKQAEEDLRWMANDERGRRVLARVIGQTGMLSPSHTPGDPLHTAYLEGRRSIGADLNAALTTVDQDAMKGILLELFASHVGPGSD